MHFSAFNNSPCAESVLEGSDLELEYFQAQTSGFSLSAPFEPKGASTPLNTSNNSWNECYQENPPRNLRHESRHSSGPSSELRNYDRQILMDRNLGNVQAFSTATGLLNFRQIPVSTSPKNVPRPIRTSRVQSYLTVPEYNMSPTVSPSNYSAFSSRNCLVPRMTPSPSSGAGIGQNCLSKRTSSPFENRQVCTSQCCGNVTNSSNYQVGHSGNIVGSRQISSLGILRDNRWSNENSSMRSNQTSRLSASSGNSACVMWSGNLPARTIQGTAYSRKVFLGGVPWDTTEENLKTAFEKFGPLKVEWPSTYSTEKPGRNSKGYLYVIFDNERSVHGLLRNCTFDDGINGRSYYYKVTSNRLRRKDVQVIPWQLADSAYVRNNCTSSGGTQTVFVGSLHGMLNAEGLARVMDDLFGSVVAVNIDTDKHKYPIGSGRVVFNNHSSYVKAIIAAFVEIRTTKFYKKIQIDPFLEDSFCSVCNAQSGPFFCRELQCFQYFCGTCWNWQHSVEGLDHHSPMMRNPRTTDEDY